MSLQFLSGPAGCGKSTYLQDLIINWAIKEPKKNFIFIVPDQFTMQTQMDIVKRHPKRGIMNIDVLSFGRLTHRIFEETGRPLYPVLDDTGKNLVLRHVAETLDDKMPYIGANIKKQGYIHEIKSQISEFMQYGLSCQDIEKIADDVNNELLKIKLRDLSTIYKAFNEYNREKFITGEETLGILCEKIEKSEILKDSVIVFDGFTGFTPIQENVIVNLLKACEKVYITLEMSQPETIDSLGNGTGLFYLSQKTRSRLINLCKEEGLPVLPDISLLDHKNGRLCNNSELSFLEKNLFRLPHDLYMDVPVSVTVTKVKNPILEVRKLALNINRLIRENGYAYRDVAVIAGDLNTYGDLIENFFNENNIPVFIDRNSPVLLNPFIEYISSALQIIIKDYSYDSVFHFLKSRFSDFTEEEVDSFDKYVSSLNLRGKNTYKKPFTRREKGMKDKDRALVDALKQEEIRKRLDERMSILERPYETAKELVSNLYEFIKVNNSYEKLSELSKKFEAENNLAKAREYKQIYRLIMELLEKMVALIGDEKISVKEFYEIYAAGIDEINVGILPESVDRVVVGDLQRTRLKEIKALFFVGMNDGFVPAVSDKAGILNSMDKERLKEKGIELSQSLEESIYTQRLYLYMYLCKPSEKLCISYSTQDIAGKSVKESYVINDLLRLFPKLETKEYKEVEGIRDMLNEKDSLNVYSKLLRDLLDYGIEGNEEKLYLANALHRFYEEKGEGLHKSIEEAAYYKYFASCLRDEIVKALYGTVITASVSRMEQFANCAYAHFLNYGMKLREEEDSEFNSLDLGIICHGVLDIFSSKLRAKNLSFSNFSKEEGEALVSEALNDYAESYEQGFLKDSAESKYTIEKIRRLMQRTVETLKYQAAKGEFLPSYFEYSFNTDFPIGLPGFKTKLTGKIDRIDIYKTDDKVYVKIIDYKSSEKNIDLSEVYYGLQEQLFIYLKEAIKQEQANYPEKKMIPSGIFYYEMKNPIVEADINISDEDLEKKIIKELKLNGYFEDSMDNIMAIDGEAEAGSDVISVNFKKDTGEIDKRYNKHASTEEFYNAMDFVSNKVKELTEDMLKGNISINPVKRKNSDSCSYCKYKEICKFDDKLNGFTTKKIMNFSEEELREKIFGGVVNGD